MSDNVLLRLGKKIYMSDTVLLRLGCVELGAMVVITHALHLRSPDVSTIGAAGSVYYIMVATIFALWGPAILRNVVQMSERS